MSSIPIATFIVIILWIKTLKRKGKYPSKVCSSGLPVSCSQLLKGSWIWGICEGDCPVELTAGHTTFESQLNGLLLLVLKILALFKEMHVFISQWACNLRTQFCPLSFPCEQVISREEEIVVDSLPRGRAQDKSLCASDLLRNCSKEKQVWDWGSQERKREEAKQDCKCRKSPKDLLLSKRLWSLSCAHSVWTSMSSWASNSLFSGARAAGGEDLPRLSCCLHNKV